MVGKIKKFRTIAFYASKKGKREQQIIQQLEEIILNLDLKILYPSSSLLRGSSGIKTVSDNYVIKQADLVMAIGGDGTLLSCSREFGKARCRYCLSSRKTSSMIALRSTKGI